ncbi:MAG TPA: alpha-glucan family phosphorylase [Terriglobales bacterium]|nr:alpha-glucan family phosphorylase [Terriglobales bacterium]
MSHPIYTSRPFETSTDALNELALDLRWSWHHSADAIWERLDPELWEATHNPWVVLQTVSQDKLQSVTRDSDFQRLVDEVVQEKRNAEESAGWFQNEYPHTCLRMIAYFSMEFMLSEALPIYSGGLGNVAGDQLKTASNLGVPVVGVGLLYQQGYFRQEIDAQGRQQALYPFNDPGQLPIRPVRDAKGEWVRILLELPGFKLWVRAWDVKVGRARLYLLDTNDPADLPAHRGITGDLYGGGPDLRLKQELVLGIGGWRLLHILGREPEVCHLNEGHAAFAVLERARSYMVDHQVPFDLALTVTRAGNLFTTHTPVDAGFDRFSPQLMETYLKSYAEEKLSIPFQDLLALGRRNPDDASEPFNMAYLAMRGSGVVNGVSRLHGAVSRRIFQVLFPGWPQVEVPVTHVTNGVHMPTWDSAEADRLWERCCGKDRWLSTMAEAGERIRQVGDSDLWQLRTEALKSLIQYVRKWLQGLLASYGRPAADVAQAAQILDPDTLTIGFARRFATYKRPNLLLHHPERLMRILTNPQRPVQLILAGKAHPQDLAGQAMIEQWIQFIRRPDVRPRAVFLSDYDMLMAERLVQGIDLWINTPRRPWEASGTSGMKVLVNGGLNLSELDGWWAEAYSPEVGWALGDGREHNDDPAWDAAEAEALYDLLEREVVPAFYTRDERGIPLAWVSRMRESMARLTPAFSSNRVVREYTEKHYLPAAEAYCERTANQSRAGADVLRWQQALARNWPKLRFGSVTAEQEGDQHVFQVQVFLGELDPDAVRVELYADGRNGEEPTRQLMNRGEPLAGSASGFLSTADGRNGEEPTRQPMNRGEPLVGSANGFLYTARVPATRPAIAYTPRLVPYKAGVRIPLEANEILWQR